MTRAEQAAYQKRARRDRADRLRWNPNLRPHGRVNTYIEWGCKCEPCRGAYAKYRRGQS